MREEVLARFFGGKATPTELARDLDGSEERVSDIERIVKIEDMHKEFEVTREMAVALCDAVLSEQLAPNSLAIIGFALMASDKFTWDGEDVVGEVIADWACPEIKYALTMDNIRKFRTWLTGGEPYPEKPGAAGANVAGDSTNIVCIRHKGAL